MNKKIAALLAIALLISLAGCGGNSGVNDVPPSNSIESSQTPTEAPETPTEPTGTTDLSQDPPKGENPTEATQEPTQETAEEPKETVTPGEEPTTEPTQEPTTPPANTAPVHTHSYSNSVTKQATCDTSGIITYPKGETKPKHWHVVLRTDVALEIDTISKWIGVPSQYIDAPKGHGAFLDCVQYLTHEDEKQQKKGKHPYLDEEVKASFDFRQELTTRAEKKIRYGKDLNDKEQMMYDVIYLGKTLSECRKENPILYMKNCKVWHGARGTKTTRGNKSPCH